MKVVKLALVGTQPKAFFDVRIYTMKFYGMLMDSNDKVCAAVMSDDYTEEEIAAERHILDFERDKESMHTTKTFKVFDETMRLVAVL